MRLASIALDLLSGLVLEDGRNWREVATEDQLQDAQAILLDTSVPYNFLTRARGYSKTTDLAAIAIVALLEQLPPGARSYALASDQDQARLLADAFSGFVYRTESIRGGFEIGANKIAATRGGQTLEILAADAAGTYGLRPSLLIVDEITQWKTSPEPRRLWEAASTAMHKVPGARMVLLSSAGDPGHWSRVILEHAYESVLWRVHEIPGPPPWADPARLEEQRHRLPESTYLRLFENVWASGEDKLDAEDVMACVMLDGPLPPQAGRRYAIGVDIGLKHDRTAVTVCHLEKLDPYWTEGTPHDQGVRVFLDRIAVWQGTRRHPVKLMDVEEWVHDAARRYGATVIFDPHQAAGMMQRLQAKGIRCMEFTFSSASVGKLASTIHTLVRNRALALPEDPELQSELANVRLRETSPGVYRLDHDPGKHDDRVIALALAAQWLLEKREQITRIGHYTFGTRTREPRAIEWMDPPERREFRYAANQRTHELMQRLALHRPNAGARR